MANKFKLNQNEPRNAPGSSAVPEPKIAEPKADWAEKTHSSWATHSGFIETSKVANIAPPPRLDPRLVRRPTPPRSLLTPGVRQIAIALALAVGICGGLYFNGVFDSFLARHAPSLVMSPRSALPRVPAATDTQPATMTTSPDKPAPDKPAIDQR